MPPLPIAQVRTFLEEIKFSHSVFALPFALVSMLVAAGGWPPGWVIFWILVACVAARTAAMSFNRIADAPFDAANPRTARRALVSGRLSGNFMWIALITSSAIFILSALMLNRLCFILAPPTLAILLLYSYTKRFTRYSHYVLGLALGLAPLGAWIAVRQEFALTPMLLGVGVILWVAGFDILYSCQDAAFDASRPDLHSMPKARGIAGAMEAARRSHAASLAFFVLFWWWAGLGVLSLLAVAGIAALMARQHGLVSPRDLSRIDAAFFLSNGIISIGFLLLVGIDILVLRALA